MLSKLFKKLGRPKWLPWVGTAPFILIPIASIIGGEVARGAGIFAFFASMWAGIILGGKLAHFVSTRLLKTSEDINKRMIAGGCAFGFLFAPVLIGLFANANLGKSIELHSLSAHFLWACVGAGIFFCASPEKPKDGS